MRTIIESSGGNGREVKKHIETDYKEGLVLWRDAEVAVWSKEDQMMALKGELVQHKAHFAALMAAE